MSLSEDSSPARIASVVQSADNKDSYQSEEHITRGETQSQTHSLVDQDFRDPPDDEKSRLSGEGSHKEEGTLRQKVLRDGFAGQERSHRPTLLSNLGSSVAADANQTSNPLLRGMIGKPHLQPYRSEQVEEALRFEKPRTPPLAPTTPSPYSAVGRQEQAQTASANIPETPATSERGLNSSVVGWFRKSF